MHTMCNDFIQDQPIAIGDLKVYHTFAFLLDASAKKTLASITEKCLAKGRLHATGRQQPSVLPKPLKVSEAPTPDPSDEELLARLFV